MRKQWDGSGGVATVPGTVPGVTGTPGSPDRDIAWHLLQANRRSFDSPVPSPRAVADRMADLEAALAAAQEDIASLRASTSWRLTRPLRWLIQNLRPRRSPPVENRDRAPPLPPLDYAAWIRSEESTRKRGLDQPRRGQRPVLAPRLGFVLLGADGVLPDPVLLAGCPASCTILVLGKAAAAPGLGLDDRVRFAPLPPDATGAHAIAVALRMLDVDLLCFLDVRDRLAPDALDRVADVLARHPQLDLVFADEDWLDAEGRRVQPFFKPGWDAELQRGRDLIGPFAFLRTSLVRTADVAAGTAWQYDLASQVAAASRPERIHRIPAVLCHRVAPPPGYAARQAVVTAQLKRSGVTAAVEAVGDAPDLQRVIYDVPYPAPLVSIIVPTRDRADLLRVCAAGLLQGTRYERFELLIVDNGTREPEALALLAMLAEDDRVRVLRRPGAFNWSALNNEAATQANGDILLLLNNDVAVLQPDWLTELVSQAIQPGVGAVGAKLLYADGRVQHAGLTTDFTGLPRHLLRYAPGDVAGPFELLGVAREVWGVTGACLAIPRQVFSSIGGLNEALPLSCNDVDLCLKLTAYGYRIVWTPWAELEHPELTSRGPDTTPEQHARAREEIDRLVRDWGSLVSEDPYLHPALDAADEQLAFRRSAGTPLSS